MTTAPRPKSGSPREYAFPSIERSTLSNGMRIAVAPMPRLPLVTVLEFDFSPWQLADFILGWFHIDICKDDAWNRFYNEEEDVQPAPQPRPEGQTHASPDPARARAL